MKYTESVSKVVSGQWQSPGVEPIAIDPIFLILGHLRSLNLGSFRTRPNTAFEIRSVYILLKFLILAIVSGCSSQNGPPPVTNTLEIIEGRDNLGPRSAIYRVKVPISWARHDSLPGESIVDTTKPLAEFLITDAVYTSTPVTPSPPIRIVIHNFPYENAEQRIPPQAQVTRWQQQFEELIAEQSSVSPQSFSGYTGLLFTGVGIQKDQPTMVLGWALQLPPEHYRSLSGMSDKDSNWPKYLQMRAEVTIKATGPIDMMERHKEDIIAFARSFESIEEFPTPL